jgi:membrane peptidoglycan carboxypeptidase
MLLNLAFAIGARAIGALMPAKTMLYVRVEQSLQIAAELSPLLFETLIAAEDRRFYQHGGVDLYAVIRALRASLFRGQLQGASTIEQQLVRVITNRREKTIFRKLREMALACWLTSKFPKRDLARAYLSVAYFGFDMPGVSTVCEQLKFRTASLSARQAVFVIARLRYPAGRKPSFAVSKRLATRARLISAELMKASFRREPSAILTAGNAKLCQAPSPRSC